MIGFEINLIVLGRILRSPFISLWLAMWLTLYNQEVCNNIWLVPHNLSVMEKAGPNFAVSSTRVRKRHPQQHQTPVYIKIRCS
jgi:hypothetical protein